MLTPDDRRAIDGLFDKVQNVEREAPPREADAEALIADKIAANPAAPYYLAQTVLMQEFALKQAEQRIAELEDAVSRRPASGGLFGGLFGGSASQQPAARPQQRMAPQEEQPRQGGPWGRQPQGGGGFMAGAAQTALGVAGGVLLGSAISGMLSPGAAHAGEPAAEEAPPEEPMDDGGFDDGSDMEF